MFGKSIDNETSKRIKDAEREAEEFNKFLTTLPKGTVEGVINKKKNAIICIAGTLGIGTSRELMAVALDIFQIGFKAGYDYREAMHD